MIETILDLLACPDCRCGPLTRIDRETMTCGACGAHFAEQEGVWNLLPHRLRTLDGTDLARAAADAKETQLRFFSENSADYDGQVAESVFWRVEDQLIWSAWYRDGAVLHGRRVLDVGAGTGRASEYLTRFADFVVVTDIAPGALRLAGERLTRVGRTNYVLVACDAETLPFKNESFPLVSAYGVLHHVQTPETAVAELSRVLTVGGRAFTIENHRSVLRPVFDWLMKLHPMWTECAGSSPVLDEQDIRRWTAGTLLDSEVEYRAIVPPHLCAVVGYGVTKPLLTLTDFAVNAVRFARPLAGLISVEFSKRRAAR